MTLTKDDYHILWNIDSQDWSSKFQRKLSQKELLGLCIFIMVE